MENQKTYKTPSKTLARMQVVHFGKITFNLQFIALAVMLASVLSFLVPAIYFIVLICVAGLSLGLAFTNPKYLALWQGGDSLVNIADAFTHSWAYTVPAVIILSFISIVCLCFDKTQKHFARIAISSIVFVIALVLFVAKYLNGGV